jgi:hypothetical protein
MDILHETSRVIVLGIGMQNQDVAIDLIISSRCCLMKGPMHVSMYDESEFIEIIASNAAELDFQIDLQRAQQPLY